MIGRTRHLPDERLYDHYRSDQCDEPVNPLVADHLADCEPCGTRYADIAEFLDGLRDEADDDTDAVFTADRLLAQRAHIARRLEHAGRTAHVISFPGGSAARRMAVGVSHGATRWVAAAAAAGLLIGIGAGVVYDSGVRHSEGQATAARMGAQPPAVLGTAASPPESAVDEFMLEIAIAADWPQTPELVPFDVLTPHVREVSD
jgi:hypothetical protein